MNDGWIKLYRVILENPRSSNPDWFSLFVHLLLMATHQPIKRVFGRQVVMLKPGQLITSRESLEKKTGINQHKIDRITKCLISEQQIEQVTSFRSRLITIVNWPKYQSGEQVNEQHLSSICAAFEHHLSTNKNIRTEEGTLPSADGGDFAEIPTEAEVVTFGMGPAGIDPDYCRRYHAKNTEGHRWVRNGRLIVWKMELVRFWNEDRERHMLQKSGVKSGPSHRTEKVAREFTETIQPKELKFK